MTSSDWKKFPYTIEEPDQKIQEKFPDSSRFLLVGPKKYCLPKGYKSVASKLYNFETRPDDVWLLGFPRTGTTLSTELIWLLCNNLDYKKAAETIMDIRFPILEVAAHQDASDVPLKEQESEKLPKIVNKLAKAVWDYENQEKRFIKTHLPPSLAPSNLLTSGCKVVYVAREPRDVCASSYKWQTSMTTLFDFSGSFEEFWNHFRNGLVFNGPYFEHVKEGWEIRNNENVLFLFYEDYIRDMKATIRILANFLGKNVTEEDVETLAEHVNIENFRNNSSVNNEHLIKVGFLKDKDVFIRNGVVAKGSEYFEEELASEAERWIDENLKNTDLKFFS